MSRDVSRALRLAHLERAAGGEEAVGELFEEREPDRLRDLAQVEVLQQRVEVGDGQVRRVKPPRG